MKKVSRQEFLNRDEVNDMIELGDTIEDQQ